MTTPDAFSAFVANVLTANQVWKFELSTDGATEDRIDLVSPAGHRFRATFWRDDLDPSGDDMPVSSLEFLAAVEEVRALGFQEFAS